jgi:benzoate-CoA ligase family protein
MPEWTPPERFNIANYFLGDRLREGLGTRTALRVGEHTWSYAEVASLAARFGVALGRLGAEPEERVLLALPDGPEYVGALFGALAAGGVVVMVNPALTPVELAAILDYVRPRTAVVGAETVATLAQGGEGLETASGSLRSLLTVGVAAEGLAHLAAQWASFPRRPRLARFEALAAAAGSAPPRFAAADTHRDDPAIRLFSGGTTGRPKAVVQSHRSYANTTELYAKAFLGYRPDDVTLAVPKLFFGYATGSNLFFPFSVGASAVLFPDRSTPEAIFREVARHRPTILVNVPTLVAQMVEHPAAAAQDFSCLRFATSAGEALPVPLYHRWKQVFGVELLDGLGTAEMWHIFLSNHPQAVRPGTLGRAVPGFTVEVRDEEGRPLPAGEVGRLWVRGASRAWGYWQEIDRTHDAFRGEWFVGGDLVSMDADGYVTYCGRSDDVMKVAGKWVVPAEVESCLLAHPAVAECAVVGVLDGQGLTKPRAYVLPRAEGALATASGASADGGPGGVGSSPQAALASELQAWVKAHLAPFKYPREVVFVSEFPRTHLGKIDRGKLRRS